MEESYRAHIKRNTEELISCTDYDSLITECVRLKILTPTMRTNLENKSPPPDVEDQKNFLHRELFKKLTTRGPNAYNLLKTALSNLNKQKALQILDQHNDTFNSISILNGRTNHEQQRILEQGSNRDGACFGKANTVENGAELMPYDLDDVMPRQHFEVRKSKKIHIDEKIGTYTMRSKNNRGVLFLVNIINYKTSKPRKGADEDSKALLHLYKELGFRRFYEKDITHEEFYNRLDMILKSKYTMRCECFVLALMTHGSLVQGQEARVEFSDGSIITENSIRERFNNVNCPYLVDKPKILLFPFCRGNRPDKGSLKVQRDGFGYENPRPTYRTLPNRSDILVCYATVRGFEALRDPTHGSWYIQTFYEQMAKNAHDTDFESILKLVQKEANKIRSTDGEQQMGSYENEGFNKNLFFNPGFWDID